MRMATKISIAAKLINKYPFFFLAVIAFLGVIFLLGSCLFASMLCGPSITNAKLV